MYHRFADGGFVDGVDSPSSNKSPLCKLFNKDEPDNSDEMEQDDDGYLTDIGYDCNQCPVRDRTGDRYCSGTGVSDAFVALEEDGSQSSEFKAQCGRHAVFLQSLKPTT